MARPPRLDRSPRTLLPALLAVALGAGALARPAPAQAQLLRTTRYRLTPADRAELTALLRGFFEAVRDGDAAGVRRAVLSRDEFRRVFAPGTDPLIEVHERHIARDVAALRERFAGGVWLGLSAESAALASLDVGPCGRVANAASQCAPGPVLEWRAQGEVRRLRIDKLVRLDGRWRLFDPRL